MAATKRKIDFSNVKEGGAFSPRHRPEGDYLARIVKVDDHTSREGNEGWVFTITLDDDKRATYPVYAGIDEKNAWKIRKLFLAAGINVPKKVVMVDPSKLVGKDIGVALEDDEYEGRMRSRVQDFIPVSEVVSPDEDDEDDEEEPTPLPTKKEKKEKQSTPVSTKKKKVKVIVEEDSDEEDDDEEDDDLDIEEL